MKSLKRILVFVLAQCGLVSLHAQQTPPPQPAPPADNPVTPGLAPKAPAAPPVQPAAAILATNVPARPMSAAEEKSARDLLRNVKVQTPAQVRPRTDPFDLTLVQIKMHPRPCIRDAMRGSCSGGSWRAASA